MTSLEKTGKTENTNVNDIKKLKKNMSFYTQIFDNFMDEMYVFKVDSLRFIQVNSTAQQNLGYSDEEFLKMTLFDIQPELTKKSFDKLVEPLQKGKKEKISFETIHKRKDNSLYFVEIHIQLNFIENQSLFVAIIIYISDRKKAEIMYLEQEKFVQTVINAVTHPFYVIDVNTFEIVLWNKASLKFGLIKGAKCYSITHNRNSHCDGILCKCPIKEIKKTKKPIMVEHLHLDKDGNKIIHEINGFPIFDKDGEVIQIIEYCLDVTKRKLAEKKEKKQQEQLLRAEKLVSLSILSAGVAHEINNPNNTILLNSQFLTKVWQDLVPSIDKVEEKEPSIKFGGIKYAKLKQNVPSLFSGISESSKRIKAIVENLKIYARKDTVGEYALINMNSVIKSSVNLMNDFIKKHTDNFDLNLEEKLPEIKANFQQIEQVIINLIQNSCQALTSNLQKITIFTKSCHENNCIQIIVKDEGVGISEKNIRLIKEPFYTTKRVCGGTGLGLSISDKIVKDHNGDLLFDSKPDFGTTVMICLPIFKKGKKVKSYEN